MRINLLHSAKAASLTLAALLGSVALGSASEGLPPPFHSATVVATTELEIEPEEYGFIYDGGWSADVFVESEEIFSRGHAERIGSVMELLVSEDGTVVAVIVSIDGSLGLADTFVSVPWSMLRTLEGRSATVPFERAEIDEAAPAETLDREHAEGAVVAVAGDVALNAMWRSSELFGLETGRGIVRDFVVTENGEIPVVIVEPQAAAGQ